MQSFDEANKFGKEFMDSGLKSFAAVTTGLQAISVEAADYSKKTFEAGSAVIEQLIGARSLDKAFEVQADYLKQAYEGFISQATRMGDLYTEMAKDASTPFESAGGKVK